MWSIIVAKIHNFLKNRDSGINLFSCNLLENNLLKLSDIKNYPGC